MSGNCTVFLIRCKHAKFNVLSLAQRKNKKSEPYACDHKLNFLLLILCKSQSLIGMLNTEGALGFPTFSMMLMTVSLHFLFVLYFMFLSFYTFLYPWETIINSIKRKTFLPRNRFLLVQSCFESNQWPIYEPKYSFLF